MRESYPNDTIFSLIEKRDAFNTYDGLEPETIRITDSLGKAIIRDIPPPSMCEGCKNGENYYMATCLHYYASKELDSIARAEYKKFKEKQDVLYKN